MEYGVNQRKSYDSSEPSTAFAIVSIMFAVEMWQLIQKSPPSSEQVVLVQCVGISPVSGFCILVTESARVQALDKVGVKLKKNFIKRNKVANVLIEEEVDDYFVGYSENYIRLYIPKEEENQDLANQILRVKLKKLYKDGAIAKIIKENSKNS